MLFFRILLFLFLAINSVSCGLKMDISGFSNADLSLIKIWGPASSPVLATPTKKVFVTGYRQEYFIPFSDLNFHENHSFNISSQSAGWGTSNITPSSNGKIIIENNAVAGTYTVDVTVIDERGYSDTSSFDLVIEALGGAAPAKESFADSNAGCVSNTTNRYNCGWWKYIPTAYTTHPTENFCVFIYYHGNGGSGDGTTAGLDANPETNDPIFEAINNGAHFPCLVFQPQTQGEESAMYIMNALQYIKELYRIDEDRIYIMGMSFGGSGVGNFGYQYGGNSYVASLITSNAHDTTDPRTENFYGDDPRDYLHSLNYLNQTTWDFHGEADTATNDRFNVWRIGLNQSLSNVLGYSGNIYASYASDADYIGNRPYESSTINWIPGNWDIGATGQSANRMTIRDNLGHSALLNMLTTNDIYDWMFSQNKDKGIKSNNLTLSQTTVLDNETVDITLSGGIRDYFGEISSVTVNLIPVGGSAYTPLTNNIAFNYETTFTVSNLAAGTYILSVAVTDTEGHFHAFPVILESINNAAVTNSVIATYNISFGATNAACTTLGADWNLIHSTSQNSNGRLFQYARKGRKIGLTEATFANSSLYLEIDFQPLLDIDDVTYNGLASTAVTGDIAAPPAPFVADALQCYWYTRTINGTYDRQENNLKFKVGGLNTNLKYNVYIIGSRDSATSDPQTIELTDINGTQTFVKEVNNTFTNTAKMTTVNNVEPNEDGTISFRVEEEEFVANVNDYAYLNAVVIEALAP